MDNPAIHQSWVGTFNKMQISKEYKNVIRIMDELKNLNENDSYRINFINGIFQENKLNMKEVSAFDFQDIYGKIGDQFGFPKVDELFICHEYSKFSNENTKVSPRIHFDYYIKLFFIELQKSLSTYVKVADYFHK